MRRLLPLAGALCMVAALGAGCDRIDPYQRPGMWHPDAAIDRNIAAMVQDPRDLASGRPTSDPNRKTGAAAVDRLWRDKAKPLPDAASPAAAIPDAPQPGGPQ